MKIVKDINLLEVIKESFTDEELFKFYFGNFKMNQVYNSPLRNDNNPSFSFFWYNNNGIRAKDFGTGKMYSPIDYVMEMYSLTYKEALFKICSDFNIDESIAKKKYIVKPKDSSDPKDSIKVVTKNTEIKVIPKKFNDADFAFWQTFGITKDTLKLYNVLSISKLWINKRSIVIKKNELAFAYYFPKSSHLKIYFPNRIKKDKWFSNTNNLMDIQGYWQADIKNSETKLLILTSSLKEVMLLHEFGVKAMAINGEGNKFHSDFIRHIKKYCKNIKSLYDWDEKGELGADYLFDQYNIPKISKPDYLNCKEDKTKDLSDAYKYCGKEKIKQFIDEINNL